MGESVDTQQVTPRSKRPERRQKKPAVGGGTPTGTAVPEKPKRITTASLAASMEQLLDLVPSLSSQLQTLAQRQDALENRVAVPTRASALGLSQPLAAGLSRSPVSSSMVANVVAPPPRTKEPALHPLGLDLDFRPTDLKALEEDKQMGVPGEGDLAKAVLAQSQALTALVGQIAQSSQDPLADLSSTSSSASTRGSQGRARLQAELAQHSGNFYLSVLRAMARRMQPTAPCTGSPAELLERGVCGTRYMERFGGYGKQRDLGLVLFQVMMVMDFLQAENLGAAKDALALLATCLDQVVLDGGRFDLAALLTLQEDPPSGIYVNRHQSTLSRARAFTQLADQRWVTVALAFIKELDVLTTKRQELTGGQSQQKALAGDPAPKAKGQPKRKGKAQGKGQSNAQEAEEE